MLSIGAVAPAGAVRSVTAGDANVFKRPSLDPQKQSGSPDSAQPGQSGQPALGSTPGGAPRSASRKLTPAQVRLVEELVERDREVRAHEAAHQAAAGSLGGAVSFTYETGPDGKSYAVGGEVPVEMSSGRTPEETLARAEQIRSAALAPTDPSPQDLQVAADASAMEAAAREQIVREQQLSFGAGAQGRQHASGRGARHDAPLPLPGQRVSQNTTSGVGTASSTSSAAQSNQSSAPSGPDEPDGLDGDAGSDSSATPATDSSTPGILQASSSSSPTSAQLQQLARLATIAYRGVGP